MENGFADKVWGKGRLALLCLTIELAIAAAPLLRRDAAAVDQERSAGVLLVGSWRSWMDDAGKSCRWVVINSGRRVNGVPITDQVYRVCVRDARKKHA